MIWYSSQNLSYPSNIELKNGGNKLPTEFDTTTEFQDSHYVPKLVFQVALCMIACKNAKSTAI